MYEWEFVGVVLDDVVGIGVIRRFFVGELDVEYVSGIVLRFSRRSSVDNVDSVGVGLVVVVDGDVVVVV